MRKTPFRGRTLAIAVAALAGAGSLSGTVAAQGAERPNVLVIITDDHRAGLSVMPFTSRWLRDGGTSYPSAFANTPLCCPARASIMTGLYAHNHGVLNNRGALNLDQDRTIQKALRAAGYHTGYVGKFLNRWDLAAPPPHFDRWAVISNVLNGAVISNDYYNGGLWNLNGNLRNVNTYSTRFLARRAVSFLRAQEAEDDTPWLLYVASAAPHPPVTPEPEYADAPVGRWAGNPATRESDLTDKPPWWRRNMSEREGRQMRAGQYRMLMSVDDMVERIARNLGALHERRSTLVVFVSDNGFSWGEHKRRGKTVPYSPSVRVPLFIRWPGHVPAGARDRRLVGHVDIAPTILAAVGLAQSPAQPLDGRSLLDHTWDRGRLLLEYWPTPDAPTTPQWASLWTRALQYTEYYAAETGRMSFRELYDLKTDPWQLENLYADADPANDPSPEDTQALAARLAQDRVCAGMTCP